MICTRCDCVVTQGTVSIETVDGNNIKCLNCPTCSLCIALNIVGFWQDLDTILENKNKPNGWYKVTTFEDRIRHFILSQIFYGQYEVPKLERKECIFAQPDPDDIILLRWCHYRPVGFYTVKHKGVVIEEKLELYAMTTLDTAYIKGECRGKGLGFEIIEDLIGRYPNQDIGFSTPIAIPMQRVLRKFLSKYTCHRYKLWEIIGAGMEGDRKLLWFSLPKSRSNNTIGPSL